MTKLRLKALVLMLLMAASAVSAHYWRPTIHMADSGPKIVLDSIFPKSFGGWTLDTRMPVQLVSPDVQALLDSIYNQLLSRTYVNAAGDRIMLSVAYGGDQSDGTRAHRPEVCYPAQGFQIIGNHEVVLQAAGQAIKARQLLAKMGGRVEPITYWVTVGDRVATSGTEQKLEQLRYGMRGLVPDGMLVRVSSIDPDEKRAYSVQQKFIADMASSLSGNWKSRIIGMSNS